MHDHPLWTRRRFVQGLAAGTALLASGWRTAWAQPALQPAADHALDLHIGHRPVNITGRRRQAIAINGSLPAPLLRFREGDTATLRVHNHLAETTSLHWHGLLVPAAMDGVPGLSFAGIAPGETFTYRFPLRQSGTYWYHGHSGYQEQLGLYGPLIIDPQEPEPWQWHRDYVLLLSDWSDLAPERLAARLKKDPHYDNRGQRTVVGFIRDARRDGLAQTWAERRAWAAMRMQPTDLADVSAVTYTYLVNGHSPAANWSGLFRPGETLRLRLINGSAMSYFDVRIPGLNLTVIAADGQPVRPVAVDELRIATGETFDVLVTTGSAPAYTVFAQNLDRSGYARATLTTRPGLVAPVPPLDVRPVLQMADMGHGPVGHDPHRHHGGQAAVQTHPASEQGNFAVDMQTHSPTAQLDDPGIGLRDNGRRVLRYADLRSAFADPDGREPVRSIELHLTGHMERYLWSFDGIPFAEAEPIRLRYGERVRLVLVNDTMMAHPIHLHGLWSDLEDAEGRFQVRKHTINMPPGSRRSFRVTADALGRWAFHCHLLYHMHGMFREVQVLP